MIFFPVFRMSEQTEKLFEEFVHLQFRYSVNNLKLWLAENNEIRVS